MQEGPLALPNSGKPAPGRRGRPSLQKLPQNSRPEDPKKIAAERDAPAKKGGRSRFFGGGRSRFQFGRRLGLGLGALFILAVDSACARPGWPFFRRDDCLYNDTARCRFEEAVEQANQEEQRREEAAQIEREKSALQGWERADELLAKLAKNLGDGMEAEIVHVRSQKLCAEKPLAEEQPVENWVCSVEPPLLIDDHEFILEFGTEGVLALASSLLDEKSSSRLLQKALKRWSSRCESGEFEAVAGEIHHQFFRCALPEGPMLMLGRFDRDLEADLWQLSFALIAVG